MPSSSVVDPYRDGSLMECGRCGRLVVRLPDGRKVEQVMGRQDRPHVCQARKGATP